MHPYKRKLVIRSVVGFVNVFAAIFAARYVAIAVLNSRQEAVPPLRFLIGAALLIGLTVAATRTLYWTWMGMVPRGNHVRESDSSSEPGYALFFAAALYAGVFASAIIRFLTVYALEYEWHIEVYYLVLQLAMVVFCLEHRSRVLKTIHEIEKRCSVRFFT